ncbi:N(alpha)-acetyltransferase 20, NatB catalytic subunit [Savitreella phatthalungensis]
MTTCRRFRATDLLEFNNVNLDVLTETYNIQFYLGYLARWPDLFTCVSTADAKLMGYIMGKCEGRGNDWHGHVTAVTIAPEYRRLGLARKLMQSLEQGSEDAYDAYFVDLFVRASNYLAIDMYKRMGYVCYRRVVDYYSNPDGSSDEDAFDMRRPLRRDKLQESIAGHGESNLIAADDFPTYR